jgi:fatty-acyl-CoA synthase
MSAYAYPLLIKQLLTTPIQQASGAEIVYRDLRRHSYPEFITRIARLGSALTRLGARPGMRIAVLDWDSHRYLECYFAVPMLGAVLMTANPRLAPEQLAYTLDHSGAEILLVHSDFVPLVAQIRDRLTKLRTLIALPDDGGMPAGLSFAGEYEALLADADPRFDFPEFDENTTATQFYTTGTTGLPKGVSFTHRQIVLHTLSLMATIMLASQQGRLSRETVYLPLTPMFHVHAWGIPYLATLAGMKQVYPGRYAPASIAALYQREGVTFSHCVPTILNMLLAAPEFRDLDLARWQVIIGGSALPRGLAEQALARGIDVYAGYGMSETCPVLSIAQVKPGLAGDEAVRARTSAGMPSVLVELRIVDEEMNDLPHDGAHQGEVVARAPHLTAGYVGNAAASETLWAGGWLHTGDIGVIGADGYLRITDRAKDVIKTGGEWVSSLDLEDLISRHPDVGEVAVIGVVDAKWGERPVALIVPKAGRTLDPESVRAHLFDAAGRGEISRFAVPERIEIVEALDKTSVGKLDKKRLRARFG